ncbi:MAG: 50S ribosomal protein L10 [Acidimicrobiaceae bacterium]|nr:50S ribosomal protein L10 [Acidimicrobiaceae bacterium]
MTVPRPEKAAVVAEVRDRLEASDAALLTEYRGLNVPQMADLRRSLRAAGGTYTIYKNTMVRLAVADLGIDVAHMLTGPTAIAFVGEGDGGDAAAVAKALRDFSRTNRALVLKGGVLGTKVLGPEDLVALADLPSRDVLLAQLAGGFQAPLVKLAGLLEALPRNFAYGLKALIDTRSAGTGDDQQPSETQEA